MLEFTEPEKVKAFAHCQCCDKKSEFKLMFNVKEKENDK